MNNNTKKTIACLLAAAMLCIGAAVSVGAAEDIPPAGYDEAVPNAASEAIPNMTPAQQPEAPRIYSMEDYQEMNDDLGVPTERNQRVPAFGDSNGEVLVDGISDLEDDESFVVSEVASATQDNVPQSRAATDNVTSDNGTATTTSGETDMDDDNGEEASTTSETNPETGRTTYVISLLVSLAALTAAPLLLRKRGNQ